MTSFTAACIQLTSQSDVDANADFIEHAVRETAKKGASFIATPENSLAMVTPGQPYPAQDDAIARLAALAGELSITLLIGSVHVPAGAGKSRNRSLLIGPDGRFIAHYDKIHLFDVTLKNGETYSESARIEGGGEAVLVKTPQILLGMTVCYDLRFAHLYRALAQSGAQMLSIPSAFTVPTGTAHWHTLLRARAIETGCYVIAPAQGGLHPGGRRTYGHSLIVGPWGEILAEGSDATPGVIYAKIDTAKVDEARAMIPALIHDRVFGVKKVP